MTRTLLRSLPLVLLLPMIIGCQSRRVLESPVEIDASEYDRVFRASIDVLRRYGFAVDRQDYRFGEVTTEPLDAPTAFEPWRRTNSTLGQVGSSTINNQQRVVRVMLEPTAPPNEAELEDESAGIIVEPTGPAEADVYLLRVEVLLQREQVPVRHLTGSTSRRRIFAHYSGVPVEWSRRGIPSRYWQTVTRDPYLESKLLAAILRRSLELPATEAAEVDTPPEPQT